MIITNNEELLKLPCSNVEVHEIADIKQALENELNNSIKLGRPGIGLAAPQIGIYKKMAIIRIDQFNLDLINSSILSSYDPFIHQDEGCLSFPGRTENVMRYQEIHLKNFDSNYILTGLMAICAQHELDHINGILIQDRAIAKPKPKIGPNQPCPCGKVDPMSKQTKKFKKCCGK